MKRYRRSIALGPEELDLLGATFERARKLVESDRGSADQGELGAIRLRLASLVLDLARDGQLSPDQIVSTAVRVIREEDDAPVD